MYTTIGGGSFADCDAKQSSSGNPSPVGIPCGAHLLALQRDDTPPSRYIREDTVEVQPPFRPGAHSLTVSTPFPPTPVFTDDTDMKLDAEIFPVDPSPEGAGEEGRRLIEFIQRSLPEINEESSFYRSLAQEGVSKIEDLKLQNKSDLQQLGLRFAQAGKLYQSFHTSRSGHLIVPHRDHIESNEGEIRIVDFEGGRQLGMGVGNSLISSVDGRSQAMEQGVQVGWKVLSINGERVNTADTVQRLKTQIGTGKDFTVTFRAQCHQEKPGDVKIMTFIIVGDMNVGKTSLLRRYCKHDYSTRTKTTRFADKIRQDDVIGLTSGGTTPVSIDIFDVPGQQSYRDVPRLYYKNVDAILMVFDITNPDSLSVLREWTNTIGMHWSHVDHELPVVGFAANKNDLTTPPSSPRPEVLKGSKVRITQEGEYRDRLGTVAEVHDNQTHWVVRLQPELDGHFADFSVDKGHGHLSKLSTAVHPRQSWQFGPGAVGRRLSDTATVHSSSGSENTGAILPGEYIAVPMSGLELLDDRIEAIPDEDIEQEIKQNLSALKKLILEKETENLNIEGLWMKTSAKTSENVRSLFQKMCQRVLANRAERTNETQAVRAVKLSNVNEPKSGGCGCG